MTLDKALESHLSTPQIKRWVIALSGGLDSMVLLDLAARYRDRIPITALHINHNQQRCAAQWVSFCKRECEARDIAFHAIEVDPASGSEACLRDARYAAFEAFLSPGDCLLLAHHADDQAETVLFRLVRAAGSAGLCGMPEARTIGDANLYRPLLNYTREALEAYARDRGLEWVEDPSNQSSVYARNYIRHKVLAPLKQQWPQVSVQIASSASILESEHALLNEFLDEQLAECAPSGHLLLARLGELSEPRQFALFRRWLQRLTGQSISRALQQRLWDQVVCAGEHSIPSYQIKHFTLYRYRGALYLAAVLSELSPWPELSSSPQQVALAQGVLSLSHSESGFCWQDGMHLASADLNTHVKLVGRPAKVLKQLLKEAGVPPWWRANWPVLCYADEIVFIPSVGVTEHWCSSGQKKHTLTVQWQPF